MDAEVTRQWLTTGVYLITLFAAIIIETLWLKKRGWAATGRAVAYVLLTDILSFGISIGASLTFGLLLLMLVFGPSGQGTDGYEGLMTFILIVGVIFPPIVFVVTKRAFLYFLKIAEGRTAWVYAIVASLLILLVTPLPSIGFYYLLRLLR